MKHVHYEHDGLFFVVSAPETVEGAEAALAKWGFRFHVVQRGDRFEMEAPHGFFAGSTRDMEKQAWRLVEAMLPVYDDLREAVTDAFRSLVLSTPAGWSTSGRILSAKRFGRAIVMKLDAICGIRVFPTLVNSDVSYVVDAILAMADGREAAALGICRTVWPLEAAPGRQTEEGAKSWRSFHAPERLVWFDAVGNAVYADVRNLVADQGGAQQGDMV